MICSQQGVAFLKSFESCRLEPYLDPGGKWTVGWGHLMQPTDLRIRFTQEEADALFDTELLHFENEVSQLVTVELRQHEFDALVSFAYNCGHEALEKSTLLKRVNAGEFAHAACEFTKWVKVDSKPLLGLYRRRCAEQAIFLLGDYSRAAA